MSFILQYPGCSKLDAASERLRMTGTSPSPETAESIMSDVLAAWESGLNFNGTIQAMQLFIRLAACATLPPSSATNTAQKASPERLRLAEHFLAIARNTWSAFIGILENRDAIAAWQAIDGLMASVISGHLHEDVIFAGFQHLENAAYPPSATAAIIVRRLLTLGIVDSRLVQLVGFLKANARFPQELALARATEARLDYQLLESSLARTGTQLDALSELRAMDESVTDTFGGEFFVDVTGDETREVGELLTRRAMAVKAEWNTRDGFVDNYVEYIIGRIEAGAGNPEHAQRVFSQMRRAGFAPYDSTIYEAYLATSAGNQAAARDAVEEVVRTYFIPTEFSEAFGGLSTAYKRAGGDQARLQNLFPMEKLVEECRVNRTRIDAAFEDAADNFRAPAIERFWHEKTDFLLKGLGRMLEPVDFDTAGDRPGRTINLPESLLTKACVDQLPGLSPIARQALLESGTGGAPASELVRQLIEFNENIGYDFATMTRLVPAWSQSTSIAVSRLDTAIQARDEAGIDQVLDQYTAQDAVPSGLLAELYGRVTTGNLCLVNREKVLLMGVKLWNASRGGSGARILKTLRAMAMEVLNDDTAGNNWVSAIDAILDTMPDDDTRKVLCDWFLARAVKHEDGRADPVLMSAGMEIGRRIGPPFCDIVRASLRKLVLAGDERGPEMLLAADITARIVRFNQWCEGDVEADRMVANWFQRWVRNQGIKAASNWEAIGDVAKLAINRTDDDESRQLVASTALRVMKARLNQPGRKKQLDAVLARVETLSALLPEASDLIEVHREKLKESRLRFWAVALGASALLAIGLLLVGFYAC